VTPLTPTACSGCGRKIYFCRDEDGKINVLERRAPLWVQAEDRDGRPLVRRVVLYQNHFASCTDIKKVRAGLRREPTLFPREGPS
jgi:hypothetical protein